LSPIETKKTLVLETGPEDMSRAAEIVRRGGLVVFPTETVYGLGANARDPAACKRIFEAKGRPQDNPLIVHVADVFELDGLAAEISPDAAALMRAFMPGPLTLILRGTAHIPPEVTTGLSTVALRVPSEPVARDFLRRAGVPVAAPSANISGRPSPTNFAMAWEAMAGRADAIIRGPDAALGLESTIVRIDGGAAEILRPGAVSTEEIRAVLHGCPVRAAFSAGEGAPPAPGMKYTHYKPRADVFLYRARVDLERGFRRRGQKKAGVLSLAALAQTPGAEPGDALPGADISVKVMPSLEEYARRLYAEFFVFDSLGCELIFAEYPPEQGLGAAIGNRLLKASAGRFV
jgi:L-threonylcarbamoyladenylate synthase